MIAVIDESFKQKIEEIRSLLDCSGVDGQLRPHMTEEQHASRRRTAIKLCDEALSELQRLLMPGGV